MLECVPVRGPFLYPSGVQPEEFDNGGCATAKPSRNTGRTPRNVSARSSGCTAFGGLREKHPKGETFHVVLVVCSVKHPAGFALLCGLKRTTEDTVPYGEEE
jgi:hypothetical protein